jgi:nitrite reductase/ring-hydroxylating ferredoxin subunit
VAVATQPVEYVAVARVADVPPGRVALVSAGERRYALVNLDGTFHALDNNCPHNGGPLAKGELIGQNLQCPWHGYTWNVADGRNTWPGVPWRAMRVPVRVVGDEIQLPVL